METAVIFRRILGPALLAFAVLAAGTPTRAASGSFNISFGDGGIANGHVGATVDSVVRASGKLVLVGVLNGTTAITKLRRNGSLDTTFGSGGITRPRVDDDIIRPAAVVLDDVENIVVAFTRTPYPAPDELGVLRLDGDGAFDPSFGTGGALRFAVPGAQSAEAADLLIDDLGRIWLLGRATMADASYSVIIARVLANGTLDPAFGSGGIAIVGRWTGEPVYPDSFVASGNGLVIGLNIDSPNWPTRSYLMRVRSTGAIDRRFGTSGLTRLMVGSKRITVRELVRRDDGRLVVGVEVQGTKPAPGVMIVKPNGTFDRTFSGDGKKVVSIAGRGLTVGDLAVEPDGDMFIAGTQNVVVGGRYRRQGYVVKLHSNGAFDTTFGGYGYAQFDYSRLRPSLPRRPLEVTTIALAGPGKPLYVAGSEDVPDAYHVASVASFLTS
jgi:uncharacterized delta-60 repeat protein